jgi:hypothetical protein
MPRGADYLGTVYLSYEMIFVVLILGSNLQVDGCKSKNGMLRFAIIYYNKELSD